MAEPETPAVAYTGSAPLAAHHAAVVYGSDGEVVHIHHVLVVEGGESPDEKRRAELALEAAGRMGHETGGLQVLHVDGSAVARNAKHAVDVEARSLRSESLPEPRRSR